MLSKKDFCVIVVLFQVLVLAAPIIGAVKREKPTSAANVVGYNFNIDGTRRSITYEVPLGDTLEWIGDYFYGDQQAYKSGRIKLPKAIKNDPAKLMAGMQLELLANGLKFDWPIKAVQKEAQVVRVDAQTIVPTSPLEIPNAMEIYQILVKEVSKGGLVSKQEYDALASRINVLGKEKAESDQAVEELTKKLFAAQAAIDGYKIAADAAQQTIASLIGQIAALQKQISAEQAKENWVQHVFMVALVFALLLVFFYSRRNRHARARNDNLGRVNEELARKVEAAKKLLSGNYKKVEFKAHANGQSVKGYVLAQVRDDNRLSAPKLDTDGVVIEEKAKEIATYYKNFFESLYLKYAEMESPDRTINTMLEYARSRIQSLQDLMVLNFTILSDKSIVTPIGQVNNTVAVNGD